LVGCRVRLLQSLPIWPRIARFGRFRMHISYRQKIRYLGNRQLRPFRQIRIAVIDSIDRVYHRQPDLGRKRHPLQTDPKFQWFPTDSFSNANFAQIHKDLRKRESRSSVQREGPGPPHYVSANWSTHVRAQGSEEFRTLTPNFERQPKIAEGARIGERAEGRMRSLARFEVALIRDLIARKRREQRTFQRNSDEPGGVSPRILRLEESRGLRRRARQGSHVIDLGLQIAQLQNLRVGLVFVSHSLGQRRRLRLG